MLEGIERCQLLATHSDEFNLSISQQLAWLHCNFMTIPFSDKNSEMADDLMGKLNEFHVNAFSDDDVTLARDILRDLYGKVSTIPESKPVVDLYLSYIGTEINRNDELQRISSHFMCDRDSAIEQFKEEYGELLQQPFIFSTDYGRQHWEENTRHALTAM